MSAGRAVTKVEIVTIGDELLLGFTIDSNGAEIARALAPLGISIVRRSSVGDQAEAIAACVREALDRTGAVITTGGLGPTSDDGSKEAVAAVFGREMELDDQHLEWMRSRWRARFGTEMPGTNRRQAMVPSGARKLDNRHGSAFGVWIEDAEGRWVAMLPGVPREMRGMLADTLLPILRERASATAGVIASRTLRTTGIAESQLGAQIEQAGIGRAGVEIAYLPSVTGVDIRLTIRGESAANADVILGETAAAVRELVGHAMYGEGAADLAATLLEHCRSRGMTIAVAESCTGGLLGARLTRIPGSSDVVIGGVIAYANAVKEEMLGVSAAAIRSDGAVSEPVVRQMAEGVRARFGAGLGIAITGVAGPGGGTDEKPVGTVWIAVAGDGETTARLLTLWGDREEIRMRAAQAAMELTRRVIVSAS